MIFCSCELVITVDYSTCQVASSMSHNFFITISNFLSNSKISPPDRCFALLPSLSCTYHSTVELDKTQSIIMLNND